MTGMKYNILYYHGFGSQLSPQKRLILERFGDVVAPLIDYQAVGIIDNAIEQYADKLIKDIDLIIGSSMGGLMGYHVAQKYNVPCLIFNPAFCHNSLGWVKDSVTGSDNNRTAMAYIVLGRKDEVILYTPNLNFIETHISEPKRIITENNMGHQIPLNLFEKHGEFFTVTNQGNVNSS